MIAYHNQPIHEFINHLRDIAINAKARASVIDQIEALYSIQDLEDELDETQTAKADAENARDQIAEELFDLLNFIPRLLGDTHDDISALELNTIFSSCLSTLERHDLYNEGTLQSLKGKLGMEP